MTVSESQFGPLVSIIVPARNEEANLASCLDSLVRQTGLSFEILVVNDASTDRTAEIARSFPVVRVMDAPPLPLGWTGKNNAVTAGAKNAAGPWLLFTDADTVHFPGSLAKAVAEAGDHGAALLSYSPEQEVHGFWEKSLMPVIFAELAATFRSKDVSNPASPAAAANGQYLLISREAYDAVGGHAAIAGSILEDVALARAVKSSGRKIFFRYGGDAVRTRMYRSFRQMCEGWTKNLALLFPHAGRFAVLRFIQFVLIVAGVVGAILFAWHGFLETAAWSAALVVVLYALLSFRILKAHFSWDANICAFFGLPLFAYLLLRSALVHKKGNVEWKGRIYSGQARISVSI
ncbi:MAG TPA: glycosyltransferase family 2 protein [Terriglobales bacterium]|jgi:glycosyltransferase involved in cell wall biosynthesis